MLTIFRENFSKSNYDTGRYTWIFTAVNVRFTVPTPKIGNRYGYN